MSIKSFVKGNINITASLNYISSLGQTEKLKTKDLTAKTCWLISICGLMRASDIHRIDDIRTIRKDNSVVFFILAPKEKRQGRPIERPCEIKPHTNLIFCPVHAYDVYKARMAMIPCPRPHINDKNLTVNHLFRYVNNPEKPLTVDSISRNIKSISKFMVNEEEQIPKARAIGATLATNSGIPADAEITQTFWSGASMLDNHYQLSRDINLNIAETILTLK
ncbi:hypothetical protein AYI69_g4880 [Smittium culicis]|uniref:Tyr recombinase domain-containing protein n=1 Tax=Smittium culicis TaxID=133412 RepID=A0A1R1YA31_9FUNG|nr:hypothetical protein AYI69_g4880 [Smittium culicis]